MPVIFFHSTWVSTEYTVLTHIGVWVKSKWIFFIPDANLTSIISGFVHKLPAAGEDTFES